MDEIDKVIKGLNACSTPYGKSCFYPVCPYGNDDSCKYHLQQDACNLLKEYRSKSPYIQMLLDKDETTLKVAIMYAENYLKYGIDVTEKWQTAVAQSYAMHQARKQGYSDAQFPHYSAHEKHASIEELVKDAKHNIGWIEEHLDAVGGERKQNYIDGLSMIENTLERLFSQYLYEKKLNDSRHECI